VRRVNSREQLAFWIGVVICVLIVVSCTAAVVVMLVTDVR